MSYINTWGCTHLAENVIAEDLSKYNIGATVKCIAEEDDILICQHDKETVRILKTGWDERKTPEFYWGETVKIIAKNKLATIELICWHYNEARYFYHLIDDNGKKISKRYYADELKKVD